MFPSTHSTHVWEGKIGEQKKTPNKRNEKSWKELELVLLKELNDEERRARTALARTHTYTYTYKAYIHIYYYIYIIYIYARARVRINK